MAARPESRWWLLTVLIVLVLLGISAFALDRPNVRWMGGQPHCPQCSAVTGLYASKCSACGSAFDWAVEPDEDSPVSRFSLSALEAELVRQRVQALGEEEAVRRVAARLEISPAAALDALRHVGRGRCGWCGGTGKELETFDEGAPCVVCLGTGQCIACAGDRRVRVGDEAAYQAWTRYELAVRDLRAEGTLLPELQRAELKRLGDAFLARHAGTAEAEHVVFWPAWRSDAETSLAVAEGGETGAAEAARGRLDALLEALGP